MRGRVGLSMTAFRGESPEEFAGWVTRVEELGFDFIELVSEWPHYITPENWREWAGAIESTNLGATLHAPFIDINVASFNAVIRETSLRIIGESLDAASRLGAEVVTLHPGHFSPISRERPGEYLEIHRASLERLGSLGEEYGVKIGVENMPLFPTLDGQGCDRLEEMLEGLNVGVTFDVGHLNTTTGAFERFIARLGERTVHVHLHDNSGESDEHRALGGGTIPWERVLKALPPVTWALEVLTLEDAEKSLRFIKRFGI